jgi:hypothetical protein
MAAVDLSFCFKAALRFATHAEGEEFMKVAFVVFCLALAGCDQLGHESSPEADADHFQLAVDSNGNAWVLDTRTGESKRCWQGSAGSSPPTCYTSIQNKK